MYQRRNRSAFVNPFQQQPIQYGSISAGAPQAGPLQPTAAEELTNMVKQKAMTGVMEKGEALAQPYVDKGIAYGTNKLGTLMGTNQAATAGTAAMENAALGTAAEGGLGSLLGGLGGATTGAATTGAAAGGMGAGMAALGTAMPYIGAGLLAGKALGFFSRGGLVGPLSKASYASNGEKITANFYNKG